MRVGRFGTEASRVYCRYQSENSPLRLSRRTFAKLSKFGGSTISSGTRTTRRNRGCIWPSLTTAFRIASLRREQLIELVEGHGPRPSRLADPHQFLSRAEEGLHGIWYAENETALSPFPQVLMARQPVLDDLFAWSASYLRVLGLLSTLSRPLTPDQFDTLLNRATPRHPWKLAGGAIGLIIGEMLFHNNKLEIDAASAASPNSTLAFAIMRAWYLGFSGGAIPEICNKYINLFEYLQRADQCLDIKPYTK